MCRMLAFTGQGEMLQDLLLTFQKLSIYGKSPDSKGHTDGWGIGYFASGRWNLFKKAEWAASSREYVKAAETVKKENPHIVLAHVRKASPNTPVTDREAHPFLEDNYLFCHNGSICRGGGQLLQELDSILFFEKILETSFKKAVLYFRTFDYTSLTCLLTDGNTIWAYRDFTEKEEYYTLYYLKTDRFVLFCSEPLIEGEWVLMKNREFITCFPDFTLVRESDLAD